VQPRYLVSAPTFAGEQGEGSNIDVRLLCLVESVFPRREMKSLGEHAQ
jgi:hypothetical protein